MNEPLGVILFLSGLVPSFVIGALIGWAARGDRERGLQARWDSTTDLFIDPEYGDDDANGLTARTAIKTVREAKRRFERPPPDYIGRPPTCANGVEGCAIKRSHSHTEALMRRIKEK